MANLHVLTGYYGYLPLQRREEEQHAYQEAIRIYRASIAKSPSPENYNNMADAYRWLGDSYLQDGAYELVDNAYKNSIAVYDEGLSRFSKTPQLIGSLIEQKANMALYFAQQWRKKKKFINADTALRVAVETARAGLQTDLLQSGLYDVLEKSGKEGEVLKSDVMSRIASSGIRADTPKELTNEIAATIDKTHVDKLLWPAGAKLDGNLLQVKQSQSWDIPPLIPGAWLQLTEAEKQVELQRIPPGTDSERRIVTRIRKLPVTFYPNAVLYEAEVRRGERESGIFDYVRSGRDVLVLDGTSNPIHDFNKKPVVDEGVSRTLLRLESLEQATQYVHFFTAAIGGESGTFRIIDSAADLPMPLTVPVSDRKNLDRVIMPLQVRQTGDGQWNAEATVRYGNSLRYAVLHLDGNPRQIPRMSADTSVGSEQPILTEHFVHGVRVMSDYNYQKSLLEERTARESKAKRWKQAAQAQGALVSLMQ
ncbi:MAG: hypothetical protein ACR2NN_15190 [Bryobacteraceae bacterium]